MSFEALISTYGYAAIAIGTFFEGETILVLAGFATHQGYFKLPWVVVFGFLGTLVRRSAYLLSWSRQGHESFGQATPLEVQVKTGL